MLRRKFTNHKGATVVEFALVLPIFLILIFAIVDFGWYFFVSHTLEFATREGSRFGLVGAGGGTPSERAAAVVATIKSHLLPAIDPGSSNLNIYFYPVDPGSPVDQAIQDAGGPGDYMRVRTTYTYQSLTPVDQLLGGILYLQGRTIVAETLYKNELFD